MLLREKITREYQAFAENKRNTLFDEERKSAFRRFESAGFPNKKEEEYKYTSLREIIEKDYNFYPKSVESDLDQEINKLSLGTGDFYKLVIVNGTFCEEFSFLPKENIKYLPIGDTDFEGKYRRHFQKFFARLSHGTYAFTDLNLAFFSAGIFLKIPKNAVIDRPIHIFYISTGQEKNTFYNTRNLLIVEEGANVKIIETHYNLDTSYTFTNSVTEIFAEKNAKSQWHKLQNDNSASYLVDHTFVSQESGSASTVNTFSFGSKIVRNNLDFIHEGEHVHSYMNGVTLIGGEQLVDHHTAVHHNFPDCESYQNYKGIYKDFSHGIFNGKVFVNKAAQKTNAYQQNNNILLSEGAVIDTKPQLEIFADDVKCSHGCTVGQLDKDALFYLRARGISKKEAQALLLYAFANDALKNIDIVPLKLKVSKLLTEKLDVSVGFRIGE
ncbi:MAG: Fe-S cluster assembly protein SufD [Bergeyella sp.]|nr:Fe-S cluster assembly protein SufD [Bergeyella sp.]